MIKTFIIIVLGVFAVAAVGTVLSSPEWGEWDDDEHHEHGYPWRDDDSPMSGGWLPARADVRPAVHAMYRTECGSCHFAYQPGLLPKKAWVRVMDALHAHYGDDASLDDQQAAEIRRYLLDNAAEHAGLSRSRALAIGSKTGGALPRITDTRYFKSEHYEIPERFVSANTQIGSFGNCQACHRNADKGVYNEHQVVIPGVGRWDN